MKRSCLFLILLILCSKGFSQNVGIGTTTPNASAALDITSTTGALLLPRMTTAQRDALTGTTGMMIYNNSTQTIQGYHKPYTYSRTTTDVSQIVSNTANFGNGMAQSFIPAISGTLASITVLYDAFSGNGTLNIKAGAGTGGTILSSQPITVLTGTSGTEITFVLSAPPSLAAGTTYTFEFVGGNTYGWRYSTTNPYANGQFYFFGAAQPGSDLYFKTIMNARVQLPLGWYDIGY